MKIIRKMRTAKAICLGYFREKLCYANDWIGLFRRRRQARSIHRMSGPELEQRLSELYLKKVKRPINWDKPETYSEKMQWAKLYDDDPRKARLADKYAVREWVKEKIGEEYLIPLLGVWEHARDIDFDKLPESFVLKANHDSASVEIIRNKSDLTPAAKRGIRHRLAIKLKTDFGARLLELHYSAIHPRIIAEKLLGEDGEDLADYKFRCYYGRVYSCNVHTGRFHEHRFGNYDRNWVPCDFKREDGVIYKTDVPKPDNYEQMIRIAETLSEGFSCVRVDLYNTGDKLYFGEMTFTPAAGFVHFTRETDLMLGDLWHVDTSKRTSAYIRK